MWNPNHRPLSSVSVLLSVVAVWLVPVLLTAAEDGDHKPLYPPAWDPVLTLHDATHMPQMGTGVYRADAGEEAYTTVQWALEVGYRLIDTAAVYGNEADVGRALADSGIPREQYYVTTKIATDGHGYQEALEACDQALLRLGTDYIDLLLIHSPFGGKIVETWDALVQLQKDGKVKSIGVILVSNTCKSLRIMVVPCPSSINWKSIPSTSKTFGT